MGWFDSEGSCFLLKESVRDTVVFTPGIFRLLFYFVVGVVDDDGWRSRK